MRLSWALSRQGKRKEATKMMRKAAAVNPGNAERWVSLGWLLYSAGNTVGSDSAFLRATKIDPDNLLLWSNWANSKIQSNNIDDIKPIIDRLEALADENAPGYMARAIVSFARQDTLTAYQHLETALDFDPKLPYAIEANIHTSWEQKDYSKVARIYEKSDLSKISKYNKQRILNIVAMSYNYLGQFETALNAIQKSIGMDSSVGYPYSTLAEIHALSGDLENFYMYLEKAFHLGLSPSSIKFELEPYFSLKNDIRLQNLMERYGKLKG